MKKQISSISHSSDRPFWARLSLKALVYAVLFCVSGCSRTDLEYSQKITTARKDCTGKEIVGVWVSKINAGGVLGGLETKQVLLIRPDGTGVLRIFGSDEMLDWRYDGAGIWSGSTHPRMHAKLPFTLRFNGSELLYERTDIFRTSAIRSVFVCADDEGAVAEHLKNRENPIKP